MGCGGGGRRNCAVESEKRKRERKIDRRKHKHLETKVMVVWRGGLCTKRVEEEEVEQQQQQQEELRLGC